MYCTSAQVKFSTWLYCYRSGFFFKIPCHVLYSSGFFFFLSITCCLSTSLYQIFCTVRPVGRQRKPRAHCESTSTLPSGCRLVTPKWETMGFCQSSYRIYWSPCLKHITFSKRRQEISVQSLDKTVSWCMFTWSAIELPLSACSTMGTCDFFLCGANFIVLFTGQNHWYMQQAALHRKALMSASACAPLCCSHGCRGVSVLNQLTLGCRESLQKAVSGQTQDWHRNRCFCFQSG